MTAEEIISQASLLPPRERAEIAEHLLAGLDTKVDPDIELAWQREVERRLEEVKRGDVKCLPWETVRERLMEQGSEPT